MKFYIQQSKVLQDFAEKSDCVIIGRCADYILREMNPVRLFIYADMESKIARCRRKGNDAEGISNKELWQKILTLDKKRARYYKFFTSQDWGDKINYDLCINTSRYSEMKAVIPGMESVITEGFHGQHL